MLETPDVIEARQWLLAFGVAEPSDALILAEIINSHADRAHRQAVASADVLKLTQSDLARLHAAARVAERVRGHLLRAEGGWLAEAATDDALGSTPCSNDRASTCPGSKFCECANCPSCEGWEE
jgi:hypothetical protein